MRDVMTGEHYYDDPDRDLKPEPVLLGRWAATDTEKERWT